MDHESTKNCGTTKRENLGIRENTITKARRTAVLQSTKIKESGKTPSRRHEELRYYKARKSRNQEKHHGIRGFPLFRAFVIRLLFAGRRAEPGHDRHEELPSGAATRRHEELRYDKARNQGIRETTMVFVVSLYFVRS
jgi:hypothetical protein